MGNKKWYWVGVDELCRWRHGRTMYDVANYHNFNECIFQSTSDLISLYFVTLSSFAIGVDIYYAKNWYVKNGQKDWDILSHGF